MNRPAQILQVIREESGAKTQVFRLETPCSSSPTLCSLFPFVNYSHSLNFDLNRVCLRNQSWRFVITSFYFAVQLTFTAIKLLRLHEGRQDWPGLTAVSLLPSRKQAGSICTWLLSSLAVSALHACEMGALSAPSLCFSSMLWWWL